MDDRFNTIAGWVLAAGIVALGGSIASGMYFKGHAPEKPGYEVADATPAEGEGGGAAAVDIATLLPTADPAKGAEVFKKCTACHTINQGGAQGIGPNLWGALGKPHGHVAGFAYSDALKGVPGNWDFAGMDKWLASPRKYAPGTKMTFAGLSKPEDRANLLAYMNSQGSNLPLPAAGAASAADTAAAGNAAAPAENAAAPAAH
ncbi:c-type cytochrome [Sphingomonas cavernae]|uniref:Cytochrome c family protein n=1 Tax=Sphingomonas cavernae TaxID=2320861 RepID=A0A418WPW3_9SPHN|nr:cytochrome c family protein [Sphingomonas cavernae]RJF93287.1 cytochrome c family protein [Sphingomonas cavernae]